MARADTIRHNGGENMSDSERRSFIGRMSALLGAVPVALAAGAAQAKSAKRHETHSSADDRLSAMEKQMQEMAGELGKLKDAQAIRHLQHAYGYYMDKCLYDQVVDLFTDDGEVRFQGGIYRGRAGQRRLYCDLFRKTFANGANGPVYGLLLDHLQLQDIIDVADDRRSAKARVRCFMQAGSHDERKESSPGIPRQWWEGGIYENTYAKGDDGIWRIRILSYHVAYQGNYEDGWAHWKRVVRAEGARTYPDDPSGPDELVSGALAAWPDTPIVPFHYPHPVTGKSSV
jgi:hypothetical protein